MDRKLGGLIFAGLLLCSPAHAVDMEKLRQMAEKERGSQWKDVSYTDSLTDERKVLLLAPASENVALPYGGEVQPSLFVACTENETSVGVSATGLPIPGGVNSVILRMDDLPAERHDFTSPGGDIMGARSPIPLVRALVSSDVEVLRVRIPTIRAYEDVTFVVHGLDRHIGKIQEACNWK